MQIKRILENDLNLLIGQSNSAKSSFLYTLIKEYKEQYNGEVFTFGLHKIVGNRTFNSLPELEKIRNAIVIIDEVKLLIDISDRRNRRKIENMFRTISHKGNKVLLSGLPSDFPRYICSKSRVFLYKSLVVSDLINGTKAKDHVLDYCGPEKGEYTLELMPENVLCFDGRYWKEEFKYNPLFDTKKENVSLFVKKSVGVCEKKETLKVSET